jgi:hypothetical protein
MRGVKKGDAIYRKATGDSSVPLLFTSPAPKEDAIRLKKLLGREGPVKIFIHKKRGEIVPERYEIRIKDRMVCTIIQEVACHSYNNFPMDDGRIICIGSLEFLTTLYLSLHIFTKHSVDILGSDAMCLVKHFIDLASKNYLSSRTQFPAFSLNCRGHQTGYASLVRQKVLRIKKEKEALGLKSKTRKVAAAVAPKKRKKTHRKQKEKQKV